MPVGARQQLQVRAAVMAQVISRALMVVAYCLQAAWTAGKSAGFLRSRTCMVPSAPEARALDHGCDRLAPKYGG